jgi:hypothetical protein
LAACAPRGIADRLVVTPGGPASPGASGTLGAPTGLKASAFSGTMVDLHWVSGSQNENGFRAEMSTDGGQTWTDAGKTIAGTTELPVTHLKPGTVYLFRVHAYGGSGDSDYSNTATVATLGAGAGLTGTYFHRWPLQSGAIKVTKMFSRVDPYIDYDWSDGMTDASGNATDAKVHNFLIVWTGQVQPLYTGKYTFYTKSDDGARLWVDGQKLIDNWTEHAATEDSGTIDLVAGKKYDIRVGYFENDSGGASMSLSWSSDQQEKEIIPQSQLYPLTAKELAAQEPATKKEAGHVGEPAKAKAADSQ